MSETETATLPPAAPASPPAPPKTYKYTEPDPVTGAITRDGVFICRYVDEVLLWEGVEFKTSYHAPVVRMLTAKQKPVKASIVQPMTLTGTVTAASAVVAGVAPLASDPYASLSPEQRAAVLRLRREKSFGDAVERRTKKPVKLDKLVGNKSDAYVLDLLRYDPVEFVRVYGVQRIGKITKIELYTDPETKVQKKRQKVIEAVLARCKTCVTEKIDAGNVVTEEDEA